MKEITVICNTKNCTEHTIPQTIKWDGLSTAQLAQLKQCPQCGQQRSSIANVDTTEKTYSSINFGKIDGMTPLERKQVLKKRSTEHYKTKIKDKKEWLDRAAIGKEKDI